MTNITNITNMTNMLKRALHITLIAAGLALNTNFAIAQNINFNADITSSATQVTTRRGIDAKLNNSSLSLKTANVNDLKTGIETNYSLLMLGKGPVTTYLRQADKTAQIGFDLAYSGKGILKSLYLIPVYAHIEDGKAIGNSTLGKATVSLNESLEMNLAYDQESRWFNHNNDSHAGYVVVSNNNSALAVGQTYDGSVRTDLGFGSKKMGGLVDVVSNHGNWEISALVAQNPKGPVASKDGAKLTQDIFTMGEFAETATHLTPVGEKTADGFAGRIKVSRNNGAYVYTPELGLSNGNVSLTIGENISNKLPTAGFAKIVYNTTTALGKAKVEGTLTQNGLGSFYVSISK